MNNQQNVFGEPLALCCAAPVTGFYRSGCCETGPEDRGLHLICAEMTEAFLAFSKARGNDLTAPIHEFGFPGLVPGDRWCLCANRWKEALDAGLAPPIVIRATHEGALAIVTMNDLKAYAIDLA